MSWMRGRPLRKLVLIISSNELVFLWCSAMACSPVVTADCNGNQSHFKGASSCMVVCQMVGEPPEVTCANFCGHLELALPRLEGRAGPTVADGPPKWDVKGENRNNFQNIKRYTAYDEDSL